MRLLIWSLCMALAALFLWAIVDMSRTSRESVECHRRGGVLVSDISQGGAFCVQELR